MAEMQDVELSAAQWHKLALHAARAKNYDATLNFLRLAIATKPRDAVLLNDCAVVLKALRRFRDSKESFECAIALAPRYAVAHSNLGNLLREMRNGAEALLSY